MHSREYLQFDGKHNYCFFISTEYDGIVNEDFRNYLWENGQKENVYVIKGDPLWAQDALLKCCEDSEIYTVLDIGCGRGNHSRIFAEYGKEVTGIDEYWSEDKVDCHNYKHIQGNFDEMVVNEQYDLIWASHILEHQLDVKTFIDKLFKCCKPSGKVAITVPLGNAGTIVSGHVNNFNLGSLLYSIVMSGYDLHDACGKTYAGNVSVIAKNSRIPGYESGDYRKMDAREYLPQGHDWGRQRFGGVCFDGNIDSLNW